MAQPEPFNMAVTNERRIEHQIFWPGFRTVEQFETVKRIVLSEHFDFACGSKIFVPSKLDHTYTGPFCFTWYNINGILHITRIGKRGNIIRELTPYK